ncbi:MAG: hypothetical protein AB8G17_06515 [Gammaproteobacteria bacterium]
MTDEQQDEQLLKDLGDYNRDRQTREALEPLSEDFQSRMAQQIKDAVRSPELDAVADITPHIATKVTRGPWLALAASVLAAVGLSVGLMSQSPIDTMPAYTVEFRGGAQMRSDASPAPIQFSDRLDVVLRPDIATDETMTVTVFRRENSQWVQVPTTVNWSESGAARIQATLDETLGLTPGLQEFAFVIARDGEFPGDQSVDADAESPDWQVLKQRFELVP